MALSDIVSRYDVVEVISAGPDHEPYMLVSEREPSKQMSVPYGDVSFAELGSSSPSPFTSPLREEYNPKLRGASGLKIYDEMRKSDGAIGGALRLIKSPVLGARWFIEPASESVKDQKIADFVWKCLTEFQSISWTQILSEALLMVDFGYYMFEKVFDTRIVDGQPRIVWQKLAPRHPVDVKEWLRDANGGPSSVVMYGSYGDGNFSELQDITIPMSKLLVFSYQRESGNIQGVSGLRTIYKHWFYKDQLYKIDAIQKERHGIGIPVIKLPPGFTPRDRTLAEELGRNLRTNERAHVVLPPNWDLIFAKLEGQPVDALKSIDHHNAMIHETILGKFLGEGVTTQDKDTYIFLKAERFIADIICDTFNIYAIKQLVDYNFSQLPNGYPKLRARGFGEDTDQRTFSFTLRNLVGAGIVVPDDKLEVYVRRYLDLPPMDPTTQRKKAQPQNPNDPNQSQNPNQPVPVGSGQAGPPRQQVVTGPFGSPRSNSGTDRSGGQ
jgi:hypothetical protein